MKRLLAAVPLLFAARLALASGLESAADQAFRSFDGGIVVGPVKPAPTREWPHVFDKVQAKGKFRPTDGEMSANFGLEDVRGSTSAPHLADYVNVWGWGWPGNFHPLYATLVSENWAIPQDGNWHIDQWLFKLDTEGGVARATHQVLIETMDRSVLDIQNERLEPGDPRIKAKLDSLLEIWRAF